MSISILLISLIFAIIEGGLSWLLLAFQPMNLFANAPLWALTGFIFGEGMLLTFILIIIIGRMNLSDRAASFVNDHFGKTVLLALLSIFAVLVVSIAGEMLYQADPLPMRKEKKADICFVLDYSSSMSNSSSMGRSRDDAMKEAFEQAINAMTSDQRVSVVRYDSTAHLLHNWDRLTDDVRRNVVHDVNAELINGGTKFDNAIKLAGEQVDKAIDAGHNVAIVMISDGEDNTFKSVREVAPTIVDHNVRIHTIWVGDSSEGNLHSISDETGGTYLTSGSDVKDLSSVLVEATKQASINTGTDDKSIADTLLTERWVSRETIINARVLRILILFLLGLWFKFIAIICIGNNDSKALVHFLHAFLVAVIAAFFVEFGYGFGLPVLVVLMVFWILMITQIVRTDR